MRPITHSGREKGSHTGVRVTRRQSYTSTRITGKDTIRHARAFLLAESVAFAFALSRVVLCIRTDFSLCSACGSALTVSFAMPATPLPGPVTCHYHISVRHPVCERGPHGAGTLPVGPAAAGCRLTRGELIAALATYVGERRLAFFRPAADGSIVCAACGLHLGTHADWPAGVVLPSLVDGVPSYKVQQVSTVTAPAVGLSEDAQPGIIMPTTAWEQGKPKQGDRGELSQGEALVQTVLPYFVLGLMTFASVGLSFDYFVSRKLIFFLSYC
jgi:hypothetical protein